MKYYYALDYINGQDGEYELVYGDQLYPTFEDAKAACKATCRPDLFSITIYDIKTLEDTYRTEIYIDEDLKVHYVEW